MYQHYIHQISSSQALHTFQHPYIKETRKMIHDFILYTRKLVHENGNKYCIMDNIIQDKQ